MANFKYYENDYELAVLELLENCGWEYECDMTFIVKRTM